MKKELKNQLKAYGFQKEVNHYYKIIGDYRFSLGCELVDLEATEIISGKVHPFGFIKTFAQIAEEIRGLTGATPTPRQTKRQEIDTLREELETVKSTLNNLSDWAMSENKRRDVDLRVLKYNLKKNGILVDSLTEPKSEPEKTEGVFKVGDPVVLVCEIELHYMNRLKMAIKDSLVCFVDELIEEECGTGYWVKIPNNDSRFWFIKSELQHAPKAFKVGVTVETFYSVGKAGQRVLIVSQSDLDNEPLCTAKAPKEAAKANSVSLEDYQNAYRCACDLLTLLDEKYYFGGVIPLESVEGVISQIDNVVAGLEKRKEAAKVLEFGDPVEVILNSPELIEGHKLMFLKFLDDENVECECIDINTDHYEVEVSHLKAL
jgi:hypothetical protein